MKHAKLHWGDNHHLPAAMYKVHPTESTSARHLLYVLVVLFLSALTRTYRISMFPFIRIRILGLTVTKIILDGEDRYAKTQRVCR